MPVRRTIEALGLQFIRSGSHIETQIGAKTVTLTMGSRVALIDGSPVDLDAAPVEVKYVLYAPLRFFTDVLGAQASFDRAAHTVNIVAQLVGRSADGLIVTHTSVERFGTVTAVDLDSMPPTLTLEYNAAIHTVPIGANAIVEMHDVAANVVVPGELGDVRPGDFTRIYMDRAGHVERVEDAFGSYTGRIAAATAIGVRADGRSRDRAGSHDANPAQWPRRRARRAASRRSGHRALQRRDQRSAHDPGEPGSRPSDSGPRRAADRERRSRHQPAAACGRHARRHDARYARRCRDVRYRVLRHVDRDDAAIAAA